MNILKKKNNLYFAITTCASWAWGTSLVMGMDVMRNKGVLPYLIWAFFNCLTLSVFGFIACRTNIIANIRDKRAFKLFALVIQMFCLIIQANIINVILERIGLSSNISVYVSAFIVIGFILMVMKKGLSTSMFTDQIQWGIALLTCVVLIFIGLIRQGGFSIIAESTPENIRWGFYSALILTAGPIGDMQHWQRAKEAKGRGKENSYYLASLIFAIYLVLVGLCGFLQFDLLMNTILLIATLAITTSTIDSIACTFHELKNKYVGTVVGMVLALTWHMFANMGVLELWSKFGTIRIAFAGVIIVVGLYYSLKGKK